MPEHNIDRSPLHLLHRAGQCVREIFENTLPGMTPRQLAVLATVADREGINQMEVARRTGIDRSTMADVIRRLVRKGRLQRRRSRFDTRAYMLRLADGGREDLPEAMRRADRVDARVLDALPKARREEFLSALLTVIVALEGMPHANRAGLPEARSRRRQPLG
jgi:DNA-binding MarR family transcriptional regulator